MLFRDAMEGKRSRNYFESTGFGVDQGKMESILGKTGAVWVPGGTLIIPSFINWRSHPLGQKFLARIILF
jgi:hypothetical protein